jgi:rhodanese-related sulfurtransferase
MKYPIAFASLIFSFSLFCAEISVKEYDHSLKVKNNHDILIDVRTPFEIKESGVISGSIVMNAYGQNFELEISKLDKMKTYLIYCHSGGRSSKTVKLMERYGLKANNLTGGILAWKKNGGEFVTHSEVTPARAIINNEFEKKIYKLIARDENLNIELPTLIKNLSDGTKYTFLDAREFNEFKVSHLPGAIHIGFDNFNLKKSNLNKNKQYIVYCSVGFRSDQINRKLIKAGFKSKNLIGGIFEWVNQKHNIYHGKILTDKVHTYNKSWSKWLDRGKKVY